MSKEAADTQTPAKGGKNKLLYSLGEVQIGKKKVPVALIVGIVVIAIGIYVGYKSGFKGLGDSPDNPDSGSDDSPVIPPTGGGGNNNNVQPPPVVAPPVVIPTNPLTPGNPVITTPDLEPAIPGLGLTGAELIDLWNPQPSNDFRPGGQQVLQNIPEWEGNTSEYVWWSPYGNWQNRLKDGSDGLQKVKKSDLPESITLSGTFAGGGTPLPVYVPVMRG